MRSADMKRAAILLDAVRAVSEFKAKMVARPRALVELQIVNDDGDIYAEVRMDMETARELVPPVLAGLRPALEALGVTLDDESDEA